MALKHAVLASLLGGEATGYELAKRMNVSVASFWHALPQQIYAELGRLEDEGLARAREVIQRSRPNKRLFKITAAGREELARFTRQPARPTAIKDELMVKVQSADVGDLEAVATALDERKEAAELRLAVWENMIRDFLGGRTEANYLRTAERIGPYLNLRRGRDFDRENIAWYEWAAAALRARAKRHSGRAGAVPAREA